MELKRNANGDFEMGEANAPGLPTRAWSKSKRGSNEYDASFEFEGGVVFLRTLGAAWNDLEPKKAEIQALQREVAAEADAIKAASQKGAKPDEIEQRGKANEARADAFMALNRSLNAWLVEQSVIGWKDLPIPFSTEARADLPDEINAEWAERILVNSPRLTDAEKVFLPTSSPSSSTETGSAGTGSAS